MTEWHAGDLPDRVLRAPVREMPPITWPQMRLPAAEPVAPTAWERWGALALGALGVLAGVGLAIFTR